MITNVQYNITFDHFTLSTPWKEELVGKNEHAPEKYVVDQLTGDCYLNESEITVREKCFLVGIGCLIQHPIAATVNLAYIAARVVTLRSYQEGQLVHDIIRMVSAPLVMVGLLFSVLYGLLFSPYDGRKLYGTLERFFYHSSIVATCFQPSKGGYDRVEQYNCLFI